MKFTDLEPCDEAPCKSLDRNSCLVEELLKTLAMGVDNFIFLFFIHLMIHRLNVLLLLAFIVLEFVLCLHPDNA